MAVDPDIRHLKLPGVTSRIRSVCVADVEPQRVFWLWQDKIAIGKLTLLTGDPGLGKSLVTLALAAAISRGACWPVGGGAAPLGSVAMLSAEDAIGDTIRPRLDAAGANCRQIHVLQAAVETNNVGKETERGFSLATDIDRLKLFVQSLGDCRLVVIDPISAYLGNADSHKNAEVRAVLAPLADMAEQLGVAVIAVTHLNKSGGNAMYRSIGSIAFTAAARTVWAVTKDKSDPDRRLVLPVKNNLAQDRLGMAYKVEADGENYPRVMWEPNPVDVDINDALSSASDEFRSERDDAIEWLKDELFENEVSSVELQKRARQAGHSWSTVRRAQSELGIKPKKSSLKDGWFWSLPARNAKFAIPKMLTPEDDQPSKGEHLGHLRQNQSLTGGKRASSSEDAHGSEGDHLQPKQAHLDSDKSDEVLI